MCKALLYKVFRVLQCVDYTLLKVGRTCLVNVVGINDGLNLNKYTCRPTITAF